MPDIYLVNAINSSSSPGQSMFSPSNSPHCISCNQQQKCLTCSPGFVLQDSSNQCSRRIIRHDSCPENCSCIMHLQMIGETDYTCMKCDFGYDLDYQTGTCIGNGNNGLAFILAVFVAVLCLIFYFIYLCMKKYTNSSRIKKDSDHNRRGLLSPTDPINSEDFNLRMDHQYVYIQNQDTNIATAGGQYLVPSEGVSQSIDYSHIQ